MFFSKFIYFNYFIPFSTLYNFQDLLAADHLVAVVLLGQLSEWGLDDTTTQTQNQMQSGLCKEQFRHLDDKTL